MQQRMLGKGPAKRPESLTDSWNCRAISAQGGREKKSKTDDRDGLQVCLAGQSRREHSHGNLDRQMLCYHHVRATYP